MTNNKPKFEVKSHSCQIADTGDYDGYWEITNGIDRIITKEDGDEIEVYLNSIADKLNELQDGIGFGIETGAEIKIQEQYFKLEGEMLELKDENKHLKELLQDFLSRHETGLLPDRFIYEKAHKYLFPDTKNKM